MFMLNRSQQIACISHDHHIHECVAGVGGEWQQANLTILTGAPRTTRRFLVGYAWPEGGTRQVPYPGPEGHLHELNVTVGGGWQRVDLTILAGAPPVTQVTTGYSWSVGHSKQVALVGDDDHIHELSVEKGQPWQHIDLTALTNAPLPASKRMVGYEWLEGRSKQVAFVSEEGHIHELVLVAGNAWQQVDLTERALAPITPVMSIDGYAWSTNSSKQVAYVGNDGDIRQLWMPLGGPWAYEDLSRMVRTLPVRI